MDRIICKICEQEATGEQINKALNGPVPTSLDVCPNCRQEVILDWSPKSQDYLERARKYLSKAETCDWCGNKIGAGRFIIFGAYKYHKPPYFCSWECRREYIFDFKTRFPQIFNSCRESERIEQEAKPKNLRSYGLFERMEYFCGLSPEEDEAKCFVPVKIIKKEE